MNRESEFGMPSQTDRKTKCGNCASYRRGDSWDGEWICTCDTSDYFLANTDYNFGCIHHEPRAQRF